MKKILLLMCVFLHSFAINSQIVVSRDMAWNYVKAHILKSDTMAVSVYSPMQIIKSRSIINTMSDNEESPDYDSWLFFVDDNPMANWSHSCRYIYISSQDMTCQISNSSYPPIINNMSVLIKYVPTEKTDKKFEIQKQYSRTANIPGSDKNYAIIISGGCNMYSNYERYWNDCSAMYSTLVNIYGYNKNNIYVLMSDGTNPADDRNLINGGYDSSPLDLDGDGVNDIQYTATRASVYSVFNQLGTILNNDDNLFLFTTDHGGQESGLCTYICLWNNEKLYDYELSSLIDSLNVGTVNICMGQCHSGGFVDNFTENNHTITTACRYDELSYAMTNLVYDEFLYHWISAVSGTTPDGISVNADIDNNGIVSMQEAFIYAENHDSKNETPQYSSLPIEVGNDIGLNHMYLSGHKFPKNPSIYTIATLPPGCSVNWSFSGTNWSTATMTANSPLLNQCSIDNTNKQYINGTLTAVVSNNGVTLATFIRNIDTGVNFSGTYSQDSYQYTNPNWYYHGTSATTFQSGDHFSLYKGPDITLTSNQFNGANITYLTGSVYGWSHNNNTVSFYFPYYANNPNSPAATTITGTYPNNYEVFQFSILGKKPIGIVHPIDNGGFSLTSTGRTYVISIGSDEIDSDIADDSWTLSVVNVITGLSKISATVSGSSYAFDTTGWESGVYVIQATVGSQTFTQKISVK